MADQETYAEYESSPSVFRGFCNRCGSTLVWRSDKDPEEVGFTTGTLDEEVLIGKREGCDGPHRGRERTETGKQLATMTGGHLWMANAIGALLMRLKLGRSLWRGLRGWLLLE